MRKTRPQNWRFKFAWGVFFAVSLSQSAWAEDVKASLTMSDITPGQSSSFTLVPTSPGAAGTCTGTATENWSGILSLSTSTCSGRYSGKDNTTRYGYRFDSFNVFRSLLSSNQLVVTNSNPVCPAAPVTYNYLLLRSRNYDDYTSSTDFTSNSAWIGGTLTYNSSASPLLNGTARFSLNALTSDTTAFGFNGFKGEACGAQAPGELRASATSFSTANRPLDTYATWLFGTNLAAVRSVGGNPLVGVAVPQSSLSASALLARSGNVYSGLLTGHTRRGNQDQRMVYLIPDATGQVFTISEGSSVSNTSLRTAWGSLNCNTLNSPVTGFCKGTLSVQGVSGTGNAACLFSLGTNSKDLIFCSAQNPSDKRSSITIMAGTSARSVLALSASFLGLPAGTGNGTIPVTVQNLTARPISTLSLSTAPSLPFSQPGSLAGSVTAPFSSGGACGTTLPAFSSCIINVSYSPSTQQANGDTFRLAYDNGVSTPNATVSLLASRGLSSIAVTAPSFAPGSTGQATVTATFANGSTQDITQLTSFVSSSSSVTVSNTSGTAGQLSSSNSTSSSLTATFGDVTSSTTVTVATGGPPSINVSINFSTNQTVITPSSGSATTTSAQTSMSSLLALAAVGSSDISSLTISGSGTFTLDVVPSQIIGDLTINSGSTLTGQAFAFYKNTATAAPNAGATPTWDVFSLDPSPEPRCPATPNGNGRLILSLSGTLTVNSGGSISMDGKGYLGGGYGPGQSGQSRSHGFSHHGYGAGGAGRYSGGGASYGTVGGGTAGSTTYGSSDFWIKLYLGAGGAGAPDYELGGYGGGAISICAATITNNGTITARGTKPNWSGGGGSGGTIYLNTTGTLSNAGTITVQGGANSTSTNTGGHGRYKLVAGTINQNGTLTGVAAASDTVTTSVVASINGNSTLTQSLYGSTSTLTVGSITNITQLLAAVGSDRPPFTLSGTGTFTFDQAYSPTQGFMDLTVGNGQTVVMNYVPSGLRDVTVNSGGMLTGQAFAFYKNTATAAPNAGATPTWDVFSLSPSPEPRCPATPNGNGRLILSLSGTLTVNSGGSISMDGKGYLGGGYGPGQSGQSRSHGFSHHGYGAGGAGRYSGGGASYGTVGGGTAGSTTYGASDFWIKLYLGAGGAGAPDYELGGYGGGAISICAATITNNGTITARGTKPNWSGGGGSGGTIYLNATDTLSNAGTITTQGGTNSTSTNIGGNGRLKLLGATVTNSGTKVGVE